MNKTELKIVIVGLEALSDKRLAYGKLWDPELKCHCVQGALCPTELWPTDEESLTWTDENGDVTFCTSALDIWAKGVGLRARALTELEDLNDEIEKETPEERYERVMAELKRSLELEDSDDN